MSEKLENILPTSCENCRRMSLNPESKQKSKKLDEIAQSIVLPITLIGTPIAAGITAGIYAYNEGVKINDNSIGLPIVFGGYMAVMTLLLAAGIHTYSWPNYGKGQPM